MRRRILSLLAFGSVWGWTAIGFADEQPNPFADQPAIHEVAPPLAPTPLPLEEFSNGQPAHELVPDQHEGAHQPGTHESGGHEFGTHGSEGQEAIHPEMHEQQHEHHAMHHAHYEHAHEHEHEEELGNVRVTPLYREIESDIWDKVFKNAYSINVGTTFWQPERHYRGFNTRGGFVTEFQYTDFDVRSGTNLNSVVSIPFAVRENLHVTDAEIYAGNLGLSFLINRHLPNSHTKVELGFSPLLTIGNLVTDLDANVPSPGDQQITLDRGASENGTLVGGDFRLWTGIATESGFRAGLTGFYGVAETDAIFDVSETLNTYGGGMYLEIPTRFVPHEFPVVAGTLQWIETILHLE